MSDTKKLLEEISKLTVLELSELVASMEEKFGVSSAPVAVAAQAAGGAVVEKKDEQSTFDVVLKSGGANKIAAIKAVRELSPNLGLKEAKDLVEAGNKEVLTRVGKGKAEEAKKILETAGAIIELK